MKTKCIRTEIILHNMFDFIYHISFTSIILILLITLLWKNLRRPSGIPPGPLGLPLLGNMLMFKGEDKRQIFDKLREEYGELFSVYFGSRLVVVLNGFNLIKEALVNNAEFFSDRPQLLLRQQLSGVHGFINLSGRVFKEHRKFIIETLKKLGFGKRNMEAKVCEEVNYCVQLIQQKEGAAFNSRNIICTSVSNITCNLIFGERFEYDDPEFVKWLDVTEEIFKKSGSASLLNYFPILKYLPGDLFQVREILKRFEYVKDFIKTRYARGTENISTDNVTDFIGAYARESSKRLQTDTDTTFTDKQAVIVISDLFAGSMETVSTTILWAFIFLMRHPDIQEEMRSEIDKVISKSELPKWEDQVQLPFTQATIMEIQRCGDVTPFSLAHAVSRDINFRGYKLPKNTIVIPFLHSVMNDSTMFPDPKEFRPSRFLDDDGNLIKPECFIPFSTGQRVCVGESLARMELFLFLTSIVQRFVITPPENECPPSLDGFVGLTHMPKPFHVRFISRQR